MSITLPIKQTVYFLKEEVNLEENYYLQDLNGEFYLEQEGYFSPLNSLMNIQKG